MPFVILPTNSASGGYDITNSLRFNKASSDYLSRTPSSSGSTTTWTYSLWVKRSDLNYISGNENCLLTTLVSGSNYNYISFSNTSSTGDKILIRQYSGGNVWIKESSQSFRDVAGWYHFVFVYNSTNATADDRVIMYVNGSRITSFSQNTNPSQNTASYFNTSVEHRIGQESNYTNNFYNGYMSEIFFIDGQALTPSSFGETDEDTGIWKPKAYTGTYGTNGFYLQFKNSASLGTDSSGNGNTWTVNNLTSIDQTTDTPTNNFCTLNPLDNYWQSSTFTEGNLRATFNSANFTYNTATIGVSKGKWYWEVKPSSTTRPDAYWYTIGGASQLTTASTSTQLGYNLYSFGYYAGNGRLTINGSIVATLSTYTTGDIIGIGLDLDNNLIYLYKNGTIQNSGTGISITASSSTPIGAWFPAVGDFDNVYSYTIDCNFGNPPYSSNSYTDGAGYGNFSYAVPSGYYSLNTRNLANFG
jgi:hypothetical protein